MLKKNKKTKKKLLKQIVLVEREAPPACPMVKKGKAMIDPRKHVGMMFKVPTDKVYEMEANDLYFSDKYIDYLKHNVTDFMKMVYDKCEFIHISDKSKEQYVCCEMVRNIKQQCFWIDGRDFVILYWSSGIFCQVHTIERNNYTVRMDEIAN